MDDRACDCCQMAVALREVAGSRPVFVAFFARWCAPCRRELAELERLRSRLGDRAEIPVVGVDELPLERIRAVARDWGFGGRVLADDGAAAVFGVPPLPGLFLLADGRVRGVWRGVAPPLEELVQSVP